jgi:hypothetical protein
MNSTIYNNYINPAHPTAFSAPGNVKRFYRNTYGKSVIDKTLAHVDSYTLHREYKKPAITNPFFVYSPREQVQMDLIDMRQLTKYNDGVTFIMVLIDCFTKKAWIKLLKNKSADSSLAALKELINEIKPQVKTILFDAGTEFKNKKVHSYLNEKNIKIIHPFSETKAAVAERFNRTIQDLIYRHNTEKETFRYVDVIFDLLSAYNNRGHRTLQYLTPEEAEKPENSAKVLCALNIYYSKALGSRKQPTLKVGQTVRIAIIRTKMTRGYQERFNQEYYKIIEVMTRMPIPMYRIQSMNNNEIIKGKFYANELQPLNGDVFKVDKVLQKRTRKGKKEVLVKWKAFDEQHNSWEPEENIVTSYDNE